MERTEVCQACVIRHKKNKDRKEGGRKETTTVLALKIKTDKGKKYAKPRRLNLTDCQRKSPRSQCGVPGCVNAGVRSKLTAVKNASGPPSPPSPTKPYVCESHCICLTHGGDTSKKTQQAQKKKTKRRPALYTYLAGLRQVRP